jgi:hypothetical protein
LKNLFPILGLAILSVIGASRLFSQQGGPNAGGSGPHPAKFQGLVRDVACPVMNPKSTSTDFDSGCASACAKAGSPLIILSNGGKIFFPISGDMPDVSQREKLMPFIGKQVDVSGTVYERAGTSAIVITTIQEIKGVKTTGRNE